MKITYPLKELSCCLNFSVKALVTDIEGTTTPISFVKDILFPYAKKNVATYLNENYDEDRVIFL